MTDREVMQMALTKLEQLRVTIDSEWGSCRDLSEIDAADEQWPEVITLRARLAEPEPEPVAWHYKNKGGASVMHWGPSARLDADMQAAKDYPQSHKVTPLYTAPPARRPLTDEEIMDAVRESDLDWQTGWSLDEDAPNRYITLIRAIDAARAALKEAK